MAATDLPDEHGMIPGESGPRRLGTIGFGTVLAGCIGGCASFVFLWGLDAVTGTFASHTRLLFGLPVVGAAWAMWSARCGDIGSTGRVIRQGRDPTAPLPPAMATSTLWGTWATHLVGGSVGREGAAVQITAGFAERAWTILLRRSGRGPLRHGELATLRRAAIAAGFGSVFGVPLAGAVFGLEAPRSLGPTDPRLDGVDAAACVAASTIGHLVVRALGHHHASVESIAPSWSSRTAAALVVVGLACGVAARALVVGRDAIGHLTARVPVPAARGALGGMLAGAVIALLGTRFGGLSLPLLDAAVDGSTTSWTVPVRKLIATTVTVGAGFPGGEVTPLLVVGASTGAAVAALFGVTAGSIAPAALTAAFGAASATPVASTVMVGEIVGWRLLPAAAVVCACATAVVGPVGLYGRRDRRRARPLFMTAGGGRGRMRR